MPENANSTESMVPKEMGSMKDGECGFFFFFFQDTMDSIVVFSPAILVFFSV